jgi:glycosyltransferase involved in cell wall biosynthesis
MLLFNTAGKGTYWRALHLARGLARQNHQVTVVATSRHRRCRLDALADKQAGVTLIESPDLLRGPLRSGWDPWNIARRLLWGRNQHFDLIHGFESRPTVIIPARFWQRRRGAPLILDWCDWFGRGGSVEERPNRLTRLMLRPVETFFEEKFRPLADGATVINRFLRDKALACGLAPGRILDLPNGSNIEEIRPSSQAKARQNLGWPQDIPIIGYMGAIFHRDALLMAQAFDHLQRHLPQAKLLLIGYCNAPVEKLVNDASAVWRTGYVDFDKISLYLAACDLCWLPMENSGANLGRYPLKINDYMAAGKPVVVTMAGEVAELVQRGAFGLLTPDQPDELAAQTLHLLHEPEKRAIMGMKGRQLAETEFTWDQIGRRLERFYQQFLERQA